MRADGAAILYRYDIFQQSGAADGRICYIPVLCLRHAAAGSAAAARGGRAVLPWSHILITVLAGRGADFVYKIRARRRAAKDTGMLRRGLQLDEFASICFKCS